MASLYVIYLITTMAPSKLFAIACLVLMMPAGEAISVARRHERARHNPPVAAIISEKGISSFLPISVGSDMLPAAGAGSVMGFCTGKAVKIGGNVAAIAVGGLYVVATVLQKAGYVTINYRKIEADVTKLMDLNKVRRSLDHCVDAAPTHMRSSPRSAGWQGGPEGL